MTDLNTLPDPDPYIIFSDAADPLEVFDWIRRHHLPVSNANGDILYFDIIENKVRELQRGETLRLSTMSVGENVPQVIGVYATPPPPAQPVTPDLFVDIRFSFERRPDEFDEDSTYVRLTKISTLRNDLDEHERTSVAEHFGQSDKFHGNTVWDIINAFEQEGTK